MALEKSLLRPLRPVKWPDAATWASVGVPELAKSSGRYYYELELGDEIGDPQIGWATTGFIAAENGRGGEGVGDDEHSWAADGVRNLSWHGGQEQKALWSTLWAAGDIVGCAIDTDVGAMRFSCNGVWCEAAGLRFETRGHAFFPAASLRGQFSFRLAATSWRFGPPPAKEGTTGDAYEALLSADAAVAAAAEAIEGVQTSSPPGVFRRPR